MMTISSHLVISLLFIVSPVTQGFDSIDVKIIPGTQQSVAGTLTFSEYGKGILIKGKITGLTPGLHGFHIHEKGDLSNYCVAAGPHFNPYQKTHGDISDANRHSGDLGNILADTYGVAHVELHDKIITLDPHSKDYVGYRAIVVHEGIDDLGKGQNEESTKTGNAGKRAGCGFISAGHLPSTIAPHHLTLGCIFLAAFTKKLF